MRNTLSSLALALLSGAAAAAQVTYTFVDQDRDETFEVYALVDGDELTGLATFNIVLSGLESTPIDPETIFYRPVRGGLFTIGFSPIESRGFTGSPLAGALDSDTFRATDNQLGGTTPILGFAAVDTFVISLLTGLEDIDGTLIDLGFGSVGAFLGRLTIPGSSAFTDAELAALFSSTAEVFDGTGSSTGVVAATSVSNVVVTIPEPSAGGLLALGGIALYLVNCEKAFSTPA